MKEHSMPPQLAHERLDVYQTALQFVAMSTDLIVELAAHPAAKERRIAEATDHLDRASLSILFSTAEGNGKRQMAVRGRFFDDARGSATECAACLDALVAKRACNATRIEEGRLLLVRIVSMLTRLVDRFTPAQKVMDVDEPYGAPLDGDEAGVTRTKDEDEVRFTE
jgi:four helix bundle protein